MIESIIFGMSISASSARMLTAIECNVNPKIDWCIDTHHPLTIMHAT